MSPCGNAPGNDRARPLVTPTRRPAGLWDLVPVTTVAAMIFLAPSGGLAAELADGTLVPLRPVGTITSESAKEGDRVGFVVIRDVVVGDTVVIARGTQATGKVIEARRARWGTFEHHGPRLILKFTQTVSNNGRVVALRSSPEQRENDRLVINRVGRKHHLQWVSEADTFNAYVDGDHKL